MLLPVVRMVVEPLIYRKPDSSSLRDVHMDKEFVLRGLKRIMN